MKHNSVYKNFLDFSCLIKPETKEKLFKISGMHPVIRNHAILKKLRHNPSARITASELAEINENIMLHSVTLAQKAATETEKHCLRAVMEQNVLAIASTAINSLITEQFQNDIHRLSKIIPAISLPNQIEENEFEGDIDYLRELEKEALEEGLA